MYIKLTKFSTHSFELPSKKRVRHGKAKRSVKRIDPLLTAHYRLKPYKNFVKSGNTIKFIKVGEMIDEKNTFVSHKPQTYHYDDVLMREVVLVDSFVYYYEKSGKKSQRLMKIPYDSTRHIEKQRVSELVKQRNSQPKLSLEGYIILDATEVKINTLLTKACLLSKDMQFYIKNGILLNEGKHRINIEVTLHNDYGTIIRDVYQDINGKRAKVGQYGIKFTDVEITKINPNRAEINPNTGMPYPLFQFSKETIDRYKQAEKLAKGALLLQI